MSTVAWALTPLDTDALDEVMAIETPVFGGDAWSAELMRAELANRHCAYFGARDPDDGTLAGYAGVLSPRGASEADVQTIAVAPQYRGTGLGRALMRALLAEARGRGAQEVFLEVRADNPVAQELYRSLGFAEIGRREGYYQPDGVAALVMKLPLGATAEGGEPV